MINSWRLHRRLKMRLKGTNRGYVLAKKNAQRDLRVLRSMNLPASLDALERHVGLPPSLLKKAEEVRLENGPVKIEAAIDDVQKLARQNVKTLDEVRINPTIMLP
jgi:hypothetical protein